ncbi:MAG: penicillin-binding protein 2, partial [Phycisphaerae bacterium]|nr:penicillin-binding protein 2 [Phycisphaerae bacterium]
MNLRTGEGLFIVVALLLLGGAGRLVYIEYTRGADLSAQAERQQTATLTIPAQRGDILDARGRVLAGTVRRPSVFMDPSSIPAADMRFAAFSVAPVFGLDAGGLHKTIVNPPNPGFVWVKRNVSDAELEAFEKVRQDRSLGAFVVRYEPRREYPHGRAAAHVLGFVQDSTQTGLAGIEQEYEEQLQGIDGSRSATVDSRRRRLDSRADEYQPPRDGASIVLTIDLYIQKLVERYLAEAVEQFNADWGTAVVLDPGSGEVLAMAVVPDFDPTQPIPSGMGADDPGYPKALERTRNRAVADSYEPGSIFKPFICAPALDDGLVRLDEQFTINGPARQFGSRTIHDTHAYSILPVHRIISKSSNIGMGLIAERCGNARLHSYVRAFGFGQLSGIELPGEQAGLVNGLANWTNYSTQSVAIGQEVALTPIQIVTAFSVFCNSGVLYRPRVVRGILDAEGGVLADYSEPVPVRRVLRPETVAAFRAGALVEVVSPEGTGRSAQIPDYQIFGKTGTAQIARADGRGYESGAYVGSFVCGAPSDEPCIAVLVSLYRPRGQAY